MTPRREIPPKPSSLPFAAIFLPFVRSSVTKHCALRGFILVSTNGSIFVSVKAKVDSALTKLGYEAVLPQSSSDTDGYLFDRDHTIALVHEGAHASRYPTSWATARSVTTSSSSRGSLTGSMVAGRIRWERQRLQWPNATPRLKHTQRLRLQ